MKQVKYIPFFISFIDGLHIALIIPALLSAFFLHPLFFDEIQLVPELLFGISLAIPLFIRASFLPLIKMTINKVSIRFIFPLFLAFLAIGNFFTGLGFSMTHVFVFIIGRILTGFGMLAFPLTLLSKRLDLHYKKKLLKTQGYGIVAGPLLGGFGMYTPLHIEFPFYAVACVCIIAFMLNISIKQEDLKQLFIAESALEKKKLFIEEILLLGIAFIFAQMGWVLYFYDTPLFALKVYHFSFLSLILLITFFCFGLYIGLGIFSTWVKKFSKKGVVIGGLIIIGFIMLIETAPLRSYFLWILSIPAGIAAGVAYTNAFSMFEDISKQQKSKSAEWFAYTIQSFGTAIGMLLLGFLSSLRDRLSLIIGFILLCIGISFYLLGSSNKSRKEKVF